MHEFWPVSPGEGGHGRHGRLTMFKCVRAWNMNSAGMQACSGPCRWLQEEGPMELMGGAATAESSEILGLAGAGTDARRCG